MSEAAVPSVNVSVAVMANGSVAELDTPDPSKDESMDVISDDGAIVSPIPNNPDEEFAADDSSSDSEVDVDQSYDETPNPRLLLAAAQVAVDANVYDYAAHVNLIDFARKLQEISVLRNSRENMVKLWPLTEALWLDWVNDEIELGELSTKEVFALFERGIKDYLAPHLWLEYCKYSLILIKQEDKDAKSQIRTIFERALTAAGVHVALGGLIYDSYRDFEEATGSDSEEDQALLKKLFQRQLSVPLNDMEDTYADFCEDFGTDNVEMKRLFEKNSAVLQKLKPFEEKLAKGSSVETYKEYLELEISLGDPGRIRCLFERAIQDNCLLPDLWAKYIEFVSRKLKDYNLCLDICKRSVRNVPWAQNAWKLYINCAEHLEKTASEVKSIFNEALICLYGDNTSEIYIAYLSYLLREISKTETPEKESVKIFRDCYHKAFDTLAQFNESLYSLKTFVAITEAKIFKNMDKFRKIFDNLILENSCSTDRWLEYISYEEQFGTHTHLRKLFLRALMYPKMDRPDKLIDRFLLFERVNGNLSLFETASLKCDAFSSHVARIEKAAALKEAAVDESSKNRAEKRGATDNNFKVPFAPPTKKKRTVEPSDDNCVSEQHVASNNRAKSAHVSTEKSNKPAKNNLAISDGENAEVSVFLSNLHFSVTEEGIREFLSQCGDIVGVSIATNIAGRSKGFGNCIFKDKSSVEKALKLDRTPLNDRPVFISTFNSKRKSTDQSASTFQFKYENKMEKQKLFVSGLNPETSSDVLKSTFSEFGEIIDVRIVTFRSGKSKGIAFVEFTEEAAAQKAIIGLDNKELEEFTISVSISNPPGRNKGGGRPTEAFKPQDFSSSSSIDYRGKGRSQVQLTSLLPRVVKKPTPQPSRPPASKSANPFKSSVAATPSSVATETSGSSSKAGKEDDPLATEALSKPLSNKDFVKFLKSA